MDLLYTLNEVPFLQELFVLANSFTLADFPVKESVRESGTGTALRKEAAAAELLSCASSSSIASMIRCTYSGINYQYK